MLNRPVHPVHVHLSHWALTLTLHIVSQDHFLFDFQQQVQPFLFLAFGELVLTSSPNARNRNGWSFIRRTCANSFRSLRFIISAVTAGSEKDEASKLVINVPSPCRISTRPIALKPLKASRTADRDTSNASANFSTDSSLS